MSENLAAGALSPFVGHGARKSRWTLTTMTTFRGDMKATRWVFYVCWLLSC